ncbi:MAG: amino acid racemase [Cocleimonas sp.]
MQQAKHETMSNMGQEKVVGVLGGMGPEATVDFMSKVIARTNAINASHDTACADQDHIRMLIDHNPRIPNRHEAIKGSGEDVGAFLADMATRLESAGADFLVMVCNTAHAFQTDIQQAAKIPFVSIIDEVIAELKNTQPQNTKVGVMAAQGCLDAELYQKALTEAGFQLIVWSGEELAEFMDTVYQIKSGNTDEKIKQAMLSLANILIDKGAEVVLAGCTEIPIVLHQDSLSVPMLSSTDILVDRVIDYSLGNISL